MKKKETLPIGSFDICLSNRCNLACRYCYFDSINTGAPQFLDFRAVKKAVDSYVGLVSVRGIDKISVAGGEPFLDFPLLLRIVRYIRRSCGPRTEIEVFTNGTLATPDKVRELLPYTGKIVVSLDGRKASNDRNRVFMNGRGSVFESVMRNLRGLTREERLHICASMTVTAATAGDLCANVRFLRELGLGEVQINLNLLERWGPADLARLRSSVKELKSYYGSLAAAELRSFEGFRFGLEYILLKWDETLKESGVFKEISAAPDGRFYPCGIVSTYGPRKGVFAIGSLERGFDRLRLHTLRRKAVRAMQAADRGVGLLEYIPNPMLLYFEALLKGEDLREVFANARRVFKVFYDELSVFLRLERFFDILSSDPLVGDFSHEPPAKADKELRSLGIAMGEPGRPAAKACACGKGWVGFPGLAPRRRAADTLLYSPGEEKELVLFPGGDSEEFELTGTLAVYAALKARALGKRLRIKLEVPPGAISSSSRT
ncbi:MAG: radical SAM protein [Elusimicrobiales bacterium]|nr:radical SAM protein [Elusimicrobiales bacterium]